LVKNSVLATFAVSGPFWRFDAFFLCQQFLPSFSERLKAKVFSVFSKKHFEKKNVLVFALRIFGENIFLNTSPTLRLTSGANLSFRAKLTSYSAQRPLEPNFHENRRTKFFTTFFRKFEISKKKTFFSKIN
jgi:hypothetical protein